MKRNWKQIEKNLRDLENENKALKFDNEKHIVSIAALSNNNQQYRKTIGFLESEINSMKRNHEIQIETLGGEVTRLNNNKPTAPPSGFVTQKFFRETLSEVVRAATGKQ